MSERHTKADEGANGISTEVENLQESFSQLRADVMDLLSHSLGLGKSGAAVVGQTASEAMDHLKERAAKLKKHGQDSIAAVEKKIEDNPLASTMIAFGVGYLVAKFLSRRR